MKTSQQAKNEAEALLRKMRVFCKDEHAAVCAAAIAANTAELWIDEDGKHADLWVDVSLYLEQMKKEQRLKLISSIEDLREQVLQDLQWNIMYF